MKHKHSFWQTDNGLVAMYLIFQAAILIAAIICG
jgi:hypothetical protein